MLEFLMVNRIASRMLVGDACDLIKFATSGAPKAISQRCILPETYATSGQRVAEAAVRLRGVVHYTPVMTCQAIDRLAGCQVFFKCENLQKVGAFKFRGATNAVLTLPANAAAKGVITHSSGNHAQALALAAATQHIPVTIVMPTSAPAVKRAAVVEYGATILDCEPTLAARERTAAEVQERTGATFVHPYDNERVIEGQGTATWELIEEVPDLHAIVIPVGGGGLLAGGCLAAAVKPGLRVFAAEPLGADDAARSFAVGERLPQTQPNTIADGLLTSLGERNWPIIRDHVEAVITVSDEEIVAAMRLLWERAKLVVEPSGAVPLAAVLKQDFPASGQRVGVIVSGGNVDLTNLPW